MSAGMVRRESLRQRHETPADIVAQYKLMAITNTQNPNPRGWRCRHFFIDLESVAFVTLGSDGLTVVRPIEPCEPFKMRLYDDEHKSLLDALEIYRSGL